MDLGFSGDVVLVVGGSGLIGQATARALVDDGATVILAARTRERVEEVAAELGTRSAVMDTQDAQQVADVVDAVYAEHGRLDAVVVTAAPSARTLDSSRDREPEQVLEAIDHKALGFLRVAEAVAPRMAEAGYGRIVGLSGQNARLTASLTGAARNQVLITIAKVLADAYAGTGVTVNVVNPGPVRDGRSTATPEPAKPGESSPDEVAAVVAFLASRVSSGVSGESIAVGHKVRGVAG